jgi:hypothetical protein
MNATPTTEPPEASSNRAGPLNGALVLLRGVVGAVVGGAVGYFVFQWLARQGLYGMMIPGALLGLGAGLAARGRSITLGIVCAVAAVVLAAIAEWQMFPFVKDKSLSFFLAHLHQLRLSTLIMIGLGAVFAYWFGQGR